MATARHKVVLAGELGKRYGREHYFVIATPAEAVRALCANFPEFKKHVIAQEENNVGYKIIINNHPTVQPEELHHPASHHAVIVIAPVIAGSKSGFGQVLFGAALIGLSFVLPTAPLIAGFQFSASSIAFNMGLSMVLGGAASFLSRPPKAPAPNEAPENKPSYAFDGPVNTVQQGQPVPVGYGKLIVGSSVISAGMTAENYSGAKND